MKKIKLGNECFLYIISSDSAFLGCSKGTMSPIKVESLSSKNVRVWITPLWTYKAIKLFKLVGNSWRTFYFSTQLNRFLLLVYSMDFNSLTFSSLDNFASLQNSLIVESLFDLVLSLLSIEEKREDRLPIANV